MNDSFLIAGGGVTKEEESEMVGVNFFFPPFKFPPLNFEGGGNIFFPSNLIKIKNLSLP
jgi:hypothetical protein